MVELDNMKKLFLLGAMLCALGMMTVEAQNSNANDTLIAGFVSRTAIDFAEFWNTEFPRSQPKRNITLITTIDPSLLPDTIIGLPVRVFPNFDDLRKRKNRKLTKEKIYRIKVDTIATDTIDVLLIGCEVTIERKQTCIAVDCRGTMGYIPDGRFVYDATTKQWHYSFYRELEEEKIKNQPAWAI